MKKAILSLSLVLTAGSFVAAGTGIPPERIIPVKQAFTRLEVADNVTILLTNQPAANISAKGADGALQRVRVAVKKGCLYVWMAGSMDGKNVTVEVPAGLLDQILVDGDSQIRSATVLDNRRLEVTVNGACKLDLRSSGRIDVLGSPDYEFTPSGN